MSLNRYAARVDANQAELVKAAERLGIKVWVIRKPVDLLILVRGKWFPVEVKSKDGNLTADQEEFMEKAYPHEVIVWRDLDDVIASAS